MKKNKEKEKIIKKVMKELTFRPYYIPSQILELFQKELLRVQKTNKQNRE